jgi:ATP-binding cassette subfamily F protein 3
MNFGKASRSGDWVLDAVDLAKGYGAPLFREFTLRVDRGDRIAILGPNGSGKTTLLRTLISDLEPDAGSVRLGTGVKIGYFDQQLTSVRPDCDAVEAVRPPGDAAFTPAMARKLLARFGVRGELALQQVGSMSGGETSKVALARLAALNVNLLVLDEPTNHLDLWARASLEDALKLFEGTLLFVSHDRYFIDRVASRVIVLEVGAWHEYEGNYSDFVGFRRNRDAAITAERSAKPAASSTAVSVTGNSPSEKSNRKGARRKRRFPYRKVEDIEADIAENEDRVARLQSSLADPEVHRDGERAKEALQAFEATRARLAELYEHWEEAVELN